MLNIGYIGSLKKQKGFFDIFNFCKTLDKNKFSFNFAGKGDVDKLLLPDNFFYNGILPREKINKFIDSCDVFIFYSECEHFSLAILEVMSRGKITINKNIPVVHEIIKNYENGIIINDMTFLNEIINDIYNDREKYNYILNNAQKTANNFSIKNTTKKTIEIYKSAILQHV
ncbi:hypothetical protein NFHSH190041_02870 [Shewanella sp. NFH-SH190041]|uniref:glycosyltransferase n=1 Tax=Shewanella sp. NFH-SH190041 TaxID=2950245 RepID=UPI0021C27C92|nr:glycosyltransferase [Shewanella sp. NFH-SH190041]BDM62835.1 hypothetical protein NFHSH190041_02870 [Shewanella sp. NFH-SH190041]